MQYGPLREGVHVFMVRVIGNSGRVIATSGVYEWTIVTSSGNAVSLSGLSSGHVLITCAVDATGDTEPHHEFCLVCECACTRVEQSIVIPCRHKCDGFVSGSEV